MSKDQSFPSELAWHLVRRLVLLRFQFPQINLQFNIISIKILAGFWAEIDKLILKYYIWIAKHPE